MAVCIPLQASAVYSSFQKANNANKTCQLKPGKGADIWRAMEPH